MGGQSMTIWSDMLDRIYESEIGVSATLTAGTGTGADGLSVTVIDKTSGLEISDQENLQTIRPAAIVRMAELTAAGIAHSELDSGSLALAAKTWRIHSHFLKPNPDGELKGEVVLLLMDESA